MNVRPSAASWSRFGVWAREKLNALIDGRMSSTAMKRTFLVVEGARTAGSRAEELEAVGAVFAAVVATSRRTRTSIVGILELGEVDVNVRVLLALPQSYSCGVDEVSGTTIATATV